MFAYIDEALNVIYVDGVPYVYGAGSMVKSPKGSIITVGLVGFETGGTYKLAVNDEVTDIKVTDGVITSLVANKIATVQTVAVTNVINLLNANAMNPAHATFNTGGEVAAARSAYNALTAPAPAQKDYVTNYAKLVAAEAALASVDAANVAADKAALTVTYNGEAATVALATTGTVKGSSITWESDKTATIKDSTAGTLGAVTRPSYTVGDVTVKLTATIDSNGVEDTKVFTVVVKALAPDADESIALDKAALTIAGDLNAVVANLTLPVAGANGTTIAWSSSNAAIITNAGVVNRPAGANVQVTLTATITKAGQTVTPPANTKVFYVTVLGE